MHAETMVLLVLAAVAVIVAVRSIADRTGVPAAALLTLIGILYAVLPGPNITLSPDLVLTLVLPPLLYSAALDSSLTAIRRNLRTVVSLSVLLVLATALTILGVAIAAAQGEGFSTPAAAGQFLVAAVGGVAAGVAVAYGVRPLRRLRRDPLSSNAISLATPFVAYLLGEAVHVSGVLAVVVAGLIIGHNNPSWASGASRLQTDAVWRLVDFLLEGFVFLLIGQQLPSVIDGLGEYETSTIVTAASITLAGVLLLRPLWLWLTEHLPQSMHMRLTDQDLDGDGEPDTEGPLPGSGRLSGREIVVLSWAGTRGVISLAAIFALPLTTDNGVPFPDRELLLFCAFLAVLVTLVGQGLTFAPLVRALGLRADEADQARLRNLARMASVEAALARLDEMEAEEHDDVDDKVIAGIRGQLRSRLSRYHRRLDLLDSAEAGEIPLSPEYEAALRLRRTVIEAQRHELLRWRDVGRLPDESLRKLERELDHEEGLLPARSTV